MEKSEKGAVGSDGSRLGCVLHSVWWKKQENVVRFKLMRVECVSFTNCILCVYECFWTEIQIHSYLSTWIFFFYILA